MARAIVIVFRSPSRRREDQAGRAKRIDVIGFIREDRRARRTLYSLKIPGDVVCEIIDTGHFRVSQGLLPEIKKRLESEDGVVYTQALVSGLVESFEI